MKTFRLRYVFEADLEIELEAEYLEAAKEKLYRMSAEELIEESYVNNYDTKYVDCESVEEEHIKARVLVTNIKWDTEGYEGKNYPLDELPEEDEFEVVVDNYHGEVEDEDYDDAIEDYLMLNYGPSVNGFEYEVLEVIR